MTDGDASKQSVVKGWSPITQEHLKYYIYALADPRDKTVFYIGKGKGDRAYQHAMAALALGDADSDSSSASVKLDLIQAIHKAGLEPDILLLRHGLETDYQAYEIEAALLDFAGLVAESGGKRDVNVALTNIAGGWHSSERGLMSASDVEALYAAEPLEQSDFTAPAIAFRIPQKWAPGMPIEDLYEATHGWWILGDRRLKARYALSVSRGVIRAIFTIDPLSWRVRVQGDRDWEPDEKRRWGFEGLLAGPEMAHFVNRDVKSWFKKGSRSPANYFNC